MDLVKIIQIKKLVALLLSATLLLSCGDGVPKTDGKNEVSVQETENLRLTYSVEGKIRYHITTPEVISYKEIPEPYDLFPQGGYIEMFDDSLKLETTIFAKNAIHNMKPQEVWMATDSVVVHNLIKGQSLYTDTLYWDIPKKQIYTDAYVKVVTNDLVLHGENGMQSDDKFRDYEFRTVRNSELFYDNNRFKSRDTAASSAP